MKSKFTTAQITKMALMVAFISVSSYIVIPLPFTAVSITGQTLAVFLVAMVLNVREAAFTMLCYWLLGLVGAPVFAGGTSGPGKMFGPLGGFYIGFIVAAILIAWGKGKKYSAVRYALTAVFVGMTAIDGIALVWMKCMTDMTWKAAFLSCVLPFIPLDIVKAFAAAWLAKPIRSAFLSLSQENISGRQGKKAA